MRCNRRRPSTTPRNNLPRANTSAKSRPTVVGMLARAYVPLLVLAACGAADHPPAASRPAATPPAPAKPVILAIPALEAYLGSDPKTRGPIGEQPFATLPLSRADAARAQQLLWADHVRD